MGKGLQGTRRPIGGNKNAHSITPFLVSLRVARIVSILWPGHSSHASSIQHLAVVCCSRRSTLSLGRWQALRSEIEASLDDLSRADIAAVYRNPQRGR